MASLVKKKKGNRLYYYLVESARVDGKPRIVHQAYLGTAEKLAELVQQRSAPIPLSATLRDFGLPGALWLAAKQSGLWPVLESLWPSPRSGPGPAHYLLLAAIHRICDPGPKTEVGNWYDQTILASEWGFSAERFTSQAFWDAFEQILPETSEAHAPAEDPLDQAQLLLLGLWKEKQLVDGIEQTSFTLDRGRDPAQDREVVVGAVPLGGNSPSAGISRRAVAVTV